MGKISNQKHNTRTVQAFQETAGNWLQDTSERESHGEGVDGL